MPPRRVGSEPRRVLDLQRDMAKAARPLLAQKMAKKLPRRRVG